MWRTDKGKTGGMGKKIGKQEDDEKNEKRN
jgi:hypothetical protein